MNAQELLAKSYSAPDGEGLPVTINCSDFKDRNDLILIGGAVTTKDRYDNDYWADSLAHVSEDGTIKRYLQVIGTVDDIELRDE